MEERPRLTVGAFIFNSNGKLLLLKSQKWGGRYLMPCGHVEFMEKLEDALRREVREETRLEIEDIKFLKYLEFLNPSQFHKKDLHFVGLQFVCKAKEGEVKINREAEEFIWVDPKEASKINLEEGTREMIEDFLKKKAF